MSSFQTFRKNCLKGGNRNYSTTADNYRKLTDRQKNLGKHLKF